MTEPRTLEQIEETPEAAPVSRQALLAAGILLALLTLTTRFWSLGDRPFHHDESIHAHQSYTLMKDGNWRYDPAYHGPFLYYANALVYHVLGASNTTARLLPAIFGLLLIAAAIPLARWIGPGAAAAYAALVLFPGSSGKTSIPSCSRSERSSRSRRSSRPTARAGSRSPRFPSRSPA
ncbi:MAG: hypothetical protein DMF55_06380 [Acidobacteria bacterium]|nr:MAG: hypothetical protein DMF55_06380 [Acidobacteriota bacterium]